MSDSSARDQLGPTDAALGAAVGAAIAARIGTPPGPAPLEPVRARARVLTHRRWARRGLGVATVLALGVLLGAIVAGRGSSAPNVITEPYLPTTSLPAATTTVPTTSVPNEGTGTGGETAPGGGTTSQWEQVDSNPIQVLDEVEISASGGVLNMHGESSDGVGTLLTSANGVDWAVHELPDQLRSRRFAASSERWAVVASEPVRGYPTVQTDTGPQVGPAERVLVSDDQGDTWTQLEIDFSVGPAESPHVTVGAGIGDVAVVGSTVAVVVVANVVVSDIDSLLVDFGVLAAGQRVCSYEYGPGSSIVFTPCEGEQVTVEDPALAFGDEGDLIMSALRAEVLTAQILTSIDDGPLEPTTTAEFGESASVTVSVVDGTLIVLDEHAAQVSADGITWTRIPLTGPVPRQPVEGPGGLWGAAGGEFGDTSVVHSPDGANWEVVSTTTGFEMNDLAGGSAGLAAVGAATAPDQSATSPQWIGISTDGVAWDWQPIDEALGVDGTDGFARVAVGEQAVVAVAVDVSEATIQPEIFTARP